METTKSADGTVIAYDRTGDGPPLLIVLGAFCDRKSFVPPASLPSRFTVCTYDRRGRGDSGDTPPYSPGLEVADLAAVIEAVSGAGASAPSAGAPRAGAPRARAFVFGHSSGAALALRAAADGVPMAAVVAYEAPYVIPGTRELAEDPSGRITALVSAGRRADAVKFWMTDVVQAPAEMIPMMENWPMWPGLQALAHTRTTWRRSPCRCSCWAARTARTGSTARWRRPPAPSPARGWSCSTARTTARRPR